MGILADIELVVNVLVDIDQVINAIPSTGNASLDNDIAKVKTKLNEALALIHGAGL